MAADESASQEVVAFLIGLTAYMKDVFPHHAGALHGEIVGARMGNERWNRVAGILASLQCIPGVNLTEPEHTVRNTCLAVVAVAQKMAHATFGEIKGAPEALEFARWYSHELRQRIGMQ